jgi:hypothetical protein
MDQPKRKGGRPKGSKNKSTLAAAALAQHGISPLQTFSSQARYWQDIVDAEMAKAKPERDEKRIEHAMDKAAQAMRDGGQYMMGKRANVQAPASEKVQPTVIRAPEVGRSSQEWLRMSAPIDVLVAQGLAPIVEPRLKGVVAAELASKYGRAIKGDRLVPLAEAPKAPEPTELEIQIERKVKESNEALQRARGGVWEPWDDPNITDETPWPPAMGPRKDN